MTWNKKDIDSSLVREISARFNMDLLTASILVRREITSPKEIQFFLEEDIRILNNPFLFVEMEEVVDRIQTAREEGEKVLIFGDRDADGIASTVLLRDALLSMGIDVTWSLPLGDESYGLSMKAVDDFASINGTLIITVDCGISNQKEITHANEKGIDTIIIDHHNPQDTIPPAYAIINPKMEDSGYPFRDLSGCAVVSKVIWALQFSDTELYNRPVCLLNVRPGNESLLVDAVKIVNLVEKNRITEVLVPGVVNPRQTRLVDFLEGEEIYVYDSELQEKMLRLIFGPDAQIGLIDLAPEIWKVFPSLQGKSLLKMRELSKLARYRDKPTEELDILINLFTALVLKKEKRLVKNFINNLDLVAIATLADLMPLRNENRLMVKLGMNTIEKTRREGLKELLERQSLLGRKLSTNDIAWQISPLINATGRMGVPDKAAELLITEERADCRSLAEQIVGLNNERKRLGDSIWTKILPVAKSSYEEFEGKFVLVGDSSINRGITGILAARLSSYFNASAIVVAFLENKAFGSLRSTGRFKVKEVLEQCSELFTDYGGHDFAAGFNMDVERFPELERRLLDIVKKMKHVEEEVESVEIDAELPISYLNPDLIKVVEFFEPYGEGNPPLHFLVRGVKIAEVEIIGKKEKQHLKLLIETGKYKWPAIFWNAAERAGRDFNLNDTVDIVFRLGRNYFNNTESLRLTIMDVRR
ncbi:MAG: single-stranded-DNA-specific exonuclease RecJ [Spirochaetes bacterium]|nr:MAG: single-stranded-DNA-specific exonuclease RecJ [Spirochaetota bacterium]